MEALGFLLVVITVAFLVARFLFSRPKSSRLSIRPPKASEPPLVETTVFDEEWLSQEMGKGKTYGEFLEELFPQILVDGKHGWQVLAEKPENKHDLDLMLACCKAQIEESSITKSWPAPAYFERVAMNVNKGSSL